MMAESKLQSKIQEYLRKEGYIVFKVMTCNRSGVSDLIACSKDGRFIAIEVSLFSVENNS